MRSLIIKNKRIVFTMIMFIIFLSFVAGFLIYNKKTSLNDKVIRFHVLANSDTNLDQELKIEIKDNIIKYVEPLLRNSKSIEESKDILISNEEKIINIANNILKENGQTYTASVELGKFDFPVKSYGDIVFPDGEYEAFRVKLGKAEGKNWWCVMFPPLCFIDTKNAVSSDKMEEELEKVLTDEEIESISQKEVKEHPVKREKNNEQKNVKKTKSVDNKEAKKEINKKEEKVNQEVGEVKENSEVKKEKSVDSSKDKPELKFKFVEIFENIFM